jgi:hypothetical protein
MTRGTNRRVLTLLIAGGLVAALPALGACGGKDAGAADTAAGSGSGSGSGGGDGTPTMKVTVDVTGDVTAKGTSSALAATHHGVDYTSCGQYAKGESGDSGDKSFVLPEYLKQAVNGKQVLVGVTVEDYTGPAGYPSDKLTDQGTPAGLSFDGKLYFMNHTSKATVTVDSSGGGKWQFTNLAVQNANNTQSDNKLSGSVTWTCSNG